MSKFDFLTADGEPLVAVIENKGEGLLARVGAKELNLIRKRANLYNIELNGDRFSVAAVKHDGVYYIDCDSVLIELRDPDEQGFAGGAGDHGAEKDKIFAPMPGKIVKIQVAVGDKVVVKQPMVIVEAMKMENQVLSKANGTVKAVHFKEGDQVDTVNPIIELDLEE